MPRLQLNKSSLARETRDLQTFQRYLPSLDLKRQQLMAEKAKTLQNRRDLKKQLEQVLSTIRIRVPMVANDDVALDDLVCIEQVVLTDVNVTGVVLPSVKDVRIQIQEYSLLAKPHWVDNYVILLSQALVISVKIDVESQRQRILNDAIKTITQRVNLFEKVLIPKALSNIKKIRIYLSDEQMASVVRAKLAKKKRIETARMT